MSEYTQSGRARPVSTLLMHTIRLVRQESNLTFGQTSALFPVLGLMGQSQILTYYLHSHVSAHAQDA